MLRSRHSHWHEFICSRPGRRFQGVYDRHLESGGRASGLRRGLLVALGFVLILAGTVMLAFPGPGLLVAFIGAFLIARELLIVARLLDRLELRVRPAYLRLRRWWRRRGRKAP